MFCMFLQKTDLPVRVYMEEPLFPEGVMRTAIVNPIRFKDSPPGRRLRASFCAEGSP